MLQASEPTALCVRVCMSVCVSVCLCVCVICVCMLVGLERMPADLLVPVEMELQGRLQLSAGLLSGDGEVGDGRGEGEALRRQGEPCRRESIV